MKFISGYTCNTSVFSTTKCKRQYIIPDPNLGQAEAVKKKPKLLAKWRKHKRCWKISRFCKSKNQFGRTWSKAAWPEWERWNTSSTCAASSSSSSSANTKQEPLLAIQSLPCSTPQVGCFCLPSLLSEMLTPRHKKILFQCLYYELHLSLRARCCVWL